MDLDAVLRRRPALALVDELAHINAPGSLHPRRFMEVCDLLQAGIDVYATLHMHQGESLNAIVTRITRVHRGDARYHGAHTIRPAASEGWGAGRLVGRAQDRHGPGI